MQLRHHTRSTALSDSEARRLDRLRQAAERRREPVGSLESHPDCFVDLVALQHLLATLRSRREALGLSLGIVAERAQIDPTALSRLENGRNPNPTVTTLARIARALECQLVLSVSTPTPPAKTASRKAPTPRSASASSSPAGNRRPRPTVDGLAASKPGPRRLSKDSSAATSSTLPKSTATQSTATQSTIAKPRRSKRGRIVRARPS